MDTMKWSGFVKALRLDLQIFTQIHGVNECAQGFDNDYPNEFDDLDENLRDIPDCSNDGLWLGRTDLKPELNILPPEQTQLVLPSTHMLHDQTLKEAELVICTKQLTQYLVAIRELVAEKSFQYSHVLRSAPSKGIRTCSRATITK